MTKLVLELEMTSSQGNKRLSMLRNDGRHKERRFSTTRIQGSCAYSHTPVVQPNFESSCSQENVTLRTSTRFLLSSHTLSKFGLLKYTSYHDPELMYLMIWDYDIIKLTFKLKSVHPKMWLSDQKHCHHVFHTRIRTRLYGGNSTCIWQHLGMMLTHNNGWEPPAQMKPIIIHMATESTTSSDFNSTSTNRSQPAHTFFCFQPLSHSTLKIHSPQTYSHCCCPVDLLKANMSLYHDWGSHG